MTRYVLLFSIIFLLLPAGSPAAAEKGGKAAAKPDSAIAAIVGEEVISLYDVDNRLALVIVTAKLSNTPEVIARLRPQIIRALIDEKLELKEAQQNNISVSDQEVTQAIAAIEQERSMKPGAIFEILQSHRIPK